MAITGDAVEPGDVVQIAPAHGAFGACFAVVEDVRAWGVTAYVQVPKEAGSEPAYVRLPTGSFLRIGEAAWRLDNGPRLPDERAADVDVDEA